MISGVYTSLPDDPDLFITNFAGGKTGAAPSGWTSRYGTGFTPTVEAVAGSLSGKALRWTKTGAARQGYSWDAVPSVANVEVLVRMRAIEAWASGENFACPYVRGGGALASETGYRLGVTGQVTGSLWAGFTTAYVAGVSTNFGPGANGPTPNYTVNTWVWARFRVIGTSVNYRLWQQGASEPGAWAETLTDSTVAAAGWTGLQQAAANPDTEIDFFGVALNGKTVPLLI